MAAIPEDGVAQLPVQRWDDQPMSLCGFRDFGVPTQRSGMILSHRDSKSHSARPGMLRNDVLRAIDIMALHDDCDDAQLARVLAEAGFSKLEAEQLVTFVPLAFSRPVLERMGVTDIPQSFSVMTRAGRWVQMALSDQPVYVLAGSIIGDPDTMAVMSNATFKHLVKRCPMANAADGLLNAGQDFSGAAMPVALSNLTAEELGYLPWWHRLRRTLFG